MAGLVSLLVGYGLMTRALRYVDFYAFTNQPIVAERPAAALPSEAQEGDSDDDANS